jgi:hypothetical protein
MFSEDQLEQLRSFPEISRDELIGYFTPTAGDVAFVDTGRGRGAPDRLGMLVQLCTLPWLGFVPDDVRSAPPAAVGRLADRLGVEPAALSLYGQRAQTRSDHLGMIAEHLGWKTAPAGSNEMKELEQFLLDRAMEHDSPTLLFSLAREYLVSAKVTRPGAIVLAKMIGTARKGAGDLTAQLVGHLLTGEVRADLDRMLLVDAGLGMTRLEWLNSPARDASAASVKTAIDKLGWFRGIDAPQMDVSALPNERRRFLAQVARRSTNQGLERRKERKYPILLALPRLIAGRERGPMFLSGHRPGPHRLATTDPRDICPETGRTRLGYDRARILLARYADGLRLHQLRHSSATHLGEANVSASVIMAKTGHKSLRSVQRYVKPGLAAVHAATETLSSPRRRG